jgi:hypothetical protein
MNKEFKLSLRKLNYVVLKKIAEKRGYRVGGSRDTVEIGEMETLLSSIKTRNSLRKILIKYSPLIIIIFSLILVVYHFRKFINLDFLKSLL